MSKEIKDFANFDLQNEENFNQLEVGDYFIDKNGCKWSIVRKDMIREWLQEKFVNELKHNIVVKPLDDKCFTARQLAAHRVTIILH